MRIQPYHADQLRFAWCFLAFYRWRTHRRKPQPLLARVTRPQVAEIVEPFGIHLLDFTASPQDIRLLASLKVSDSVSTAASKLKGRLSHTLSQMLPSRESQQVLARGNFATTVGKSTAAAIEEYLEQQGAHHGYTERPSPPVFVRTFPLTDELSRLLQTDHAVTLCRFHIVLATWRRRGVFAVPCAELVTRQWQSLQTNCRFFVEKVSFVPDHVHVAVRLHPTVLPNELVVCLMNKAQDVMWERGSEYVIRAGVEQLWQPSAYVGSFGELTSNEVSAYLKRFEACSE